MIIYKTEDFMSDAEKLPDGAVRILKRQEIIFVKNWLDTRLHAKRLKELDGVYSFRVTRRYRALFYFKSPNEAVFFTIGHRKDVYRS